MQISLNAFQAEVDQLHQTIINHYSNEKIITDGIVDVPSYYKAPIRIMWILKEPYCDKQGGGGGWSMTDGLKIRATGVKKDSQSTWHPIIYTSWGILNQFTPFEQMPRLATHPQMSVVLNQIAFMNVQKLPAKTRTIDKDIQKAFEQNKDILLQQLQTYRPDIVIGGNTLRWFKKSLDIQCQDNLPYGHFTNDRRLYLNTMHPAQTKIAREEYVNKLIQRAKEGQVFYN